MTHVKFEAKHTGDERWIKAGPEAFALHVWALIYCDQQTTDGRISRVMAGRVATPVTLARTPKAIAALVREGFWEEVDGGYQIMDYQSHCLSAEEIHSTKEGWAVDRRRRRWHNNGNHKLCNPAKCRGAVSEADSEGDSGTDSGTDSGVESGPLYKTRPDQTRPDRRSGIGSGAGSADDACPPSGSPARRHRFNPEPSPPHDCQDCNLPERHGIHRAQPATIEPRVSERK